MRIDEALVTHGAPTLAGLKTANLFPLRTNGENITPEIRRINRLLSGKGIRLIPLRTTEKNTLIYLYRPDFLRRDLDCPEAACILRQKGYPCQNPDKCIVRLIRHLTEDEDFPHEIGLFLGYPPEDVEGFMKSSSEGVKCVGCWKVYGNQEEAEKTFAKYKHCTNVYCKELERGRSLERLAVNTGKKPAFSGCKYISEIKKGA